MPNDEEGQKAIDALNETEFEGKNIAISVARPRTERPAGGNRGGGYGGGGNRGGGYGGGNRGGMVTAAAIVAVAMAAEIAVEDINLTT